MKCGSFAGAYLNGTCTKCGWTLPHHIKSDPESGATYVVFDGDVTDKAGFAEWERGVMDYFGIVAADEGSDQ